LFHSHTRRLTPLGSPKASVEPYKADVLFPDATALEFTRRPYGSTLAKKRSSHLKSLIRSIRLDDRCRTIPVLKKLVEV